MKQQKTFVFSTIMLLAAYLLSACAGSAQAAAQTFGQQAGLKVHAVEVAFTGTIESMNGTEWIVNGETITVDPTLVQNDSFAVGDSVKVEGVVNQDETVSATHVETAGAINLAKTMANGPTLSTTSDPNSMSALKVASGNSNEDSYNEVYGTVDAIDATSITVDGQVYNLVDFNKLYNTIVPGDFVEIKVITNADGSLTVYKIEVDDKSKSSYDDSSDDFDEDSSSNQSGNNNSYYSSDEDDDEDSSSNYSGNNNNYSSDEDDDEDSSSSSGSNFEDD